MRIFLALSVLVLLIGLMVSPRSEQPEVKRAERAAAAEQKALRSSPVPHSKKPRIRLRTQAEPAHEEGNVAELMAWLETEEAGRLRPEQLAQYLAKNRRSAESLLAAFRTTGEKAFLKEAVAKYSGDPQIHYTALFQSETPEERRRHVEAFQAAAPDNAFANYLRAHDLFQAGHPEEAWQEVKVAAGKLAWEDYARAFMKTSEEAYLAAGYSAIGAKATAGMSLFPLHLAEMKGLGREISDLALRYQAAGDGESAAALRELGLALGQRYQERSPDSSVMKEIVGINIQSQILATVEPGSPYDDGITVQSRQESLLLERKHLNELLQESRLIFPTLSEQDLTRYFAQRNRFGEVEAMRELMERYRGR